MRLQVGVGAAFYLSDTFQIASETHGTLLCGLVFAVESCLELTEARYPFCRSQERAFRPWVSVDPVLQAATVVQE